MNQSNYNSQDLAKILKPLYQDLIDDTKDFEHQDLISFCIQWGNKYSTILSPNIIFYGRANNGWMCFDREVDAIFNPENDERAFNREDQMTWVEDCANSIGHYNTNKSAFWRIVRGVSRYFFQHDELFHICWSNLCKVAPYGKNPSDALYYAQLSACQKIMEREISIFQPRHVVLLTGFGWAKDFLEYLNKDKKLIPEEVLTWDKSLVSHKNGNWLKIE